MVWNKITKGHGKNEASEEPDWIFDPIPPSGARQGGVPTAHVYTPDIDTFVREIIQNCLDQKCSDLPVVVRFSLEEINGQNKRDLLDAIGWEKLSNHLESAATAGFTTISPRLTEGLQRIANDPLILLRIDDCNTYGLEGGEDEPSRNFNALCRNVLDTAEDRPNRGGSYGMGKAVLWSFSSISTVLFSSTVNNNSHPQFRYFGRTELPYHVYSGEEWSGPGWFGAPDIRSNGQLRAKSLWNDQARTIANHTNLLRSEQHGTGTSILILGFFEPLQEENRAITEICMDILNSATRWFWPSLAEPNFKLKVSVEASRDGLSIFSQEAAINDEVIPLAKTCAAEELVDRISQPGHVAQRNLTFRIPVRKPTQSDAGNPEQDIQIALKVRQCGPNDLLEHQNTVALMRGSGMVVQYKRCRVPLSDQPFHAVLLAGLANGNSDGDQAAELFFRAAEPPSHREWNAGTDRVRSEYGQGGQARISRLWTEIDNAIVQMCEQEVVPDSEGPRRLAKLFRLGGARGSGTAKFRVVDLFAHLDDGVWSFSGHVIRQRKEQMIWYINVGAWLAGETGKGSQIGISHLHCNGCTVEQFGLFQRIVVPANRGEIEFQGETAALDEVSEEDLIRRTKMRIDVRPFIGGIE